MCINDNTEVDVMCGGVSVRNDERRKRGQVDDANKDGEGGVLSMVRLTWTTGENKG